MFSIAKKVLLWANETEVERFRRRKNERIEKLKKAVLKEEHNEKIRYHILVKQRTNIAHRY